MMSTSQARFDLINMQLATAVQHLNQLYFSQADFLPDTTQYTYLQEKIDGEQAHIDYLTGIRNELVTEVRTRKIKELETNEAS